MPELPDLSVYVEALERHAGGRRLERVRLYRVFLLRSVSPPIEAVRGRRLRQVGRLGKRIVLGLDGGLFLVVHLMIAGRLRWRRAGAAIPKGNGLAAFDFAHGTLLFTESGHRKRASLHVVEGEDGLRAFDRGGLEVAELDLHRFGEALRRENHTLKRALTDPRILSGIGNAYSDEILHAARLSPFKQTRSLSGAELAGLFRATRETLDGWTRRLRAETGEGFPEKVTAFREGMAVHGRYRKPCPVCGAPVQRIVHAENEANYCPVCQTGGRVLADRALSRLLKATWPKSVEELEARAPAASGRLDERPRRDSGVDELDARAPAASLSPAPPRRGGAATVIPAQSLPPTPIGGGNPRRPPTSMSPTRRHSHAKPAPSESGGGNPQTTTKRSGIH